MNNHLVSPPLKNWPKPLKILVFVYLFIIFCGFSLGVYFLFSHTQFEPAGIVGHYKGNLPAPPPGQPIKIEKSVTEMMMTTHNHMLGLSSVFFILGVLYLFTCKKNSKLAYLSFEPLLSLFITFGSLWLMRYLSAQFVYLIILSGSVMTISFYWMTFYLFYYLLFASGKPAEAS